MESPVINSTPTETPSLAPEAKRSRRQGSDTLVLFWYPGGFHLAVLRRQSVVEVWTSRTPPQNPEEVGPTLDEGLGALDFSGTETTVVLDHALFRHQVESTPPLPTAAIQALLRGKVERAQTEAEGVLWVAEPLASARTESAFHLHTLPSAFYRTLNNQCLSRQLDVTRLLPASVVLERLRPAAPLPAPPALMVAELGSNVGIQAFDTKNRLLVSRFLRADWRGDGERIGVEVNRFALYVKQRFGLSIAEVRIAGRIIDETVTEITKRCPKDSHVTVSSTLVADWLQAIAGLPPHHPTNLLSQYLARKRKLRLWRQAIIALAWLGVVGFGLSVWNLQQNSAATLAHYERLRLDESKLIAERDRLQARNAELDKLEEVVSGITGGRLPSIPPRFLSVLSQSAPANLDLTECSLRFDQASQAWSFRIAGQIHGDEFTVQETFTAWQNSLSRGVLRINLSDTGKGLTPATMGENPSLYRFSLEGGLLAP